MWKEDEAIANEIAKCLNEDFISHRAVINYKEAEDLGLKIRYLSPTSEEWKLVWEYHIQGTNFLNQKKATKLFESHIISLQRKVLMMMQPTPSSPLPPLNP